ncbi:SIMPL domain-containing protein [Xinfangfangia sp. CPCC 101601]|uniref:SIMPL domain-containing protein n=1 Tax=Pseudogemmobacter lacusdianii TaxID=3069608 RepID=A0ABU0VTX5_9RHOB|nr:SIMPL domain-containing protein [Xinfangfangia sp. CPCC 101601]MDQ2064993.1 SIMPL domain-containing protein [Xinfangfangia sp. CPCC 101601]
MLNRLFPATALGLLLALPLSVPAFADHDPARITVTGEGASEIAPDLATLQVGVTTTGATAAEALAANSTALEAVLQRLRDAGVEGRDLQTSNLTVNPNWSGYDSSASGPQITGYTAMNMITVKLRKLDGLGAVLDAAVQDGANTLNSLTFGLQNPRPAMDAARQAAVEDAAAKAKLYAEAAGLKLGKIQEISESSGYGGGPAPMMKQAAASAEAVPVEAGQLSMQANVTVVYELED